MGQKINSLNFKSVTGLMQQLKGALVFHLVGVIPEIKNRTIAVSKPVSAFCKYIFTKLIYKQLSIWHWDGSQYKYLEFTI